jgi:hypothetical protein
MPVATWYREIVPCFGVIASCFSSSSRARDVTEPSEGIFEVLNWAYEMRIEA